MHRTSQYKLTKVAHNRSQINTMPNCPEADALLQPRQLAQDHVRVAAIANALLYQRQP